MSKILLVANWKANDVDLKLWFSRLKIENLDPQKMEITIAAPYPLITNLKDLKTIQFSLASQDVSSHQFGAYTGEVPAQLLSSIGVKYSLLGHSERRKYFGETTQEVSNKLDECMSAKITPIICAQTLQEIPDNVEKYDPASYLIMYEPAAAISTNGQYHPDSPENIQNTLIDWQKKLPIGVKFLYGGSVNPANVSQMTLNLKKSVSQFNGYVIGHASLDPQSFSEIITVLCGLPD